MASSSKSVATIPTSEKGKRENNGQPVEKWRSFVDSLKAKEKRLDWALESVPLSLTGSLKSLLSCKGVGSCGKKKVGAAMGRLMKKAMNRSDAWKHQSATRARAS